MRKSPGRRSSPLVVVFSLTLALAACGTQEPAGSPGGGDGTAAPTAAATDVAPDQLTGSLTVLDWAGYDDPAFWIDFQEMYPGVDVSFEIGASDADIYAKMAAGDQADVFHPYTGWLQFYVDEGLVEEIDTSRLSNWDKVPDSFKEIGQIDGKQYFLPWDWGFTSVLYRTDKVEGEITSWSALLDPSYSGHISMWDDGPGAVTVSSYIHGWDETAITDEQLEQIKAEWMAQREHNLFYWAGEPELTEAMAGKVFAAGHAESGNDIPVLLATTTAEKVDGGYRFTGRKAFGSLTIAFPVALLLIFMQLAGLFRSYVQPLVVMAAIPFAVQGAIIGHWLTGHPITILSLIGLVALTGIVVNDSLILIEFFNEQRRNGQAVHDALVAAVEARDRYTQGHSARVSQMAVLMGEAMRLSGAELRSLGRGGLIHDVGKQGVRDEVLFKPGRLSPEERQEMESYMQRDRDQARTAPIRSLPKPRHEPNWRASE